MRPVGTSRFLNCIQLHSFRAFYLASRRDNGFRDDTLAAPWVGALVYCLSLRPLETLHQNVNVTVGRDRQTATYKVRGMELGNQGLSKLGCKVLETSQDPHNTIRGSRIPNEKKFDGTLYQIQRYVFLSQARRHTFAYWEQTEA